MGTVDCGDASSTKDPTMSRLEADKQRELWNDIARNRKKNGVRISYSTGDTRIYRHSAFQRSLDQDIREKNVEFSVSSGLPIYCMYDWKDGEGKHSHTAYSLV